MCRRSRKKETEEKERDTRQEFPDRHRLSVYPKEKTWGNQCEMLRFFSHPVIIEDWDEEKHDRTGDEETRDDSSTQATPERIRERDGQESKDSAELRENDWLHTRSSRIRNRLIKRHAFFSIEIDLIHDKHGVGDHNSKE